jgi:hypothetical protein
MLLVVVVRFCSFVGCWLFTFVVPFALSLFVCSPLLIVYSRSLRVYLLVVPHVRFVVVDFILAFVSLLTLSGWLPGYLRSHFDHVVVVCVLRWFVQFRYWSICWFVVVVSSVTTFIPHSRLFALRFAVPTLYVGLRSFVVVTSIRCSRCRLRYTVAFFVVVVVPHVVPAFVCCSFVIRCWIWVYSILFTRLDSVCWIPVVVTLFAFPFAFVRVVVVDSFVVLRFATLFTLFGLRLRCSHVVV